jgi:AcrR family transcriptional regulator
VKTARPRRTQEARFSTSRAHILAAALKLFSTVGYHGTSIRDIAHAARASTGNVYHQFPDKESIFRALLEEYFQQVGSPDFPFNKALAAGAFPSDLEAIARAARESVANYKPYVALIYVDVVEFDGSHIRRFYSEMASRFEAFLSTHHDTLELELLRDDVSALTAVMVASRLFLHYFAVELLFGVANHFGSDTDAAMREVVDILKHGMLKPEVERGRQAKPSKAPPLRAAVTPAASPAGAPGEVARLHEENTRLRRLVADLTLDKDVLTDALRQHTSPKPR